jgi:hypothetical protein
MKRYFIFILFLGVLFAQSTFKVALDPNATGKNTSNIDSATEKALRDAMENALVNLKAGRKNKRVFTVAARGDDLKKQLEEQNFQLTSGCTPRECAAEIGKILNIDYMLIPTMRGEDLSERSFLNSPAANVNDVRKKAPPITFTAKGDPTPSSANGKPSKVFVSFKLIDVQTGELVGSVGDKLIPLCNVQYRNNLINGMIIDLYNSDQEELIRTAKEVKKIKLKPPPCAKEILSLEELEEEKSSNNMLLITVGLLLLVVAAAGGGGGGGGAPTGGVDIGIDIP